MTPCAEFFAREVLDGEQVARAVRLSRTLKPGSGGFLQTDEGIWVSPDDQAHATCQQFTRTCAFTAGSVIAD